LKRRKGGSIVSGIRQRFMGRKLGFYGKEGGGEVEHEGVQVMGGDEMEG